MTTMIDRGSLTERMRGRIRTPWGLSDEPPKEIGRGIATVSTPSHGGYKVSEERSREFRGQFPGVETFVKGCVWFEEDCDWALVAMCWPSYFSEEALAYAYSTVVNFQAKRFATIRWYLEREAGGIAWRERAEEFFKKQDCEA